MVKHHRNTDAKTGNRDHIRTTALDRCNELLGGLKLYSFTPETSHSVTYVIQTFSWLFGSQEKYKYPSHAIRLENVYEQFWKSKPENQWSCKCSPDIWT